MLASILAILATCEAINGLEASALGTLVEACEMVDRAGTRRAGEEVLEAAVVVLSGATQGSQPVGRRHRRLRPGHRAIAGPEPGNAPALAAVERTLGSRRFADAREAGRKTARASWLAEVRATADAARRREVRLRAEFGTLTSREMEVLRPPRARPERRRDRA